MNTVVLNELQINQKLQRIAYEIIENNFEDKELYLVGITGNGVKLVDSLEKILSNITDQKIIKAEVTVNKKDPFSQPIKLSCDSKLFKNATVILIDDVINSGKTMQYALVKILEQPIRKVKTVALVDRKHRRYPIRCDYVGLTLSTTLQDRVEVDFSKDAVAYLV